MCFFFLYSYGLIHSDNDNETVYYRHKWRNAATTISPFSVYNLIEWRGDVCPDISNANCSRLQPIRLSLGQYRLRFSALKHFGNEMNSNDFERYYTPAFNLVY